MSIVHVACKLPNGLIMELIEPGKLNLPAPMGKRVMLKGSNSTHTVKGENPQISRFAVTDVEESFARKWFEANKDAAFIRNGSVFIEEKEKVANAVAKERSEVSTGLEPLHAEKDPRIPAGAKADKDQLKRLGAVA
jgi:hypothetical protein